MFSLLSTDRADMDQQAAVCEYKQMVDKRKIDISGKLDEIKRACGIEADATLADKLGTRSQNILNWRKRGAASGEWTRDALELIADRTGASTDWMLGRSEVAFPNGVKLKTAAPLEKRVQRTEADIDQARAALGALFEVLNRKLPELGLAAAYEEALEAVAPSEAYAEKGFHGLLAAFVGDLAELAEAAPAPARSRAARLPSGKKGAK
jgi:hypothetical protein